MILTTTPSVEGRRIEGYLGIVGGQLTTGVKNNMPELLELIKRARASAIDAASLEAKRLGADAVVGIVVDSEIVEVGESGTSRLGLISVTGTAVKLA